MRNYSEYINWNRALKCLNIDLKGMSKLHRDLCELTIDYMLDDARLEHTKIEDKYTIYVRLDNVEVESIDTEAIVRLLKNVNYIVHNIG